MEKIKQGAEIIGTLIGIPGVLSIASLIFFSVGISFVKDGNFYGLIFFIPGLAFVIADFYALGETFKDFLN